MEDKKKEFKISEYLSLKLEGKHTVIYVNNEPFRHCTQLLFDIPIGQISEYDSIMSIDEVSEILEKTSKQTEYIEIPPEAEFWLKFLQIQKQNLDGNKSNCLKNVSWK